MVVEILLDGYGLWFGLFLFPVDAEYFFIEVIGLW